MWAKQGTRLAARHNFCQGIGLIKLPVSLKPDWNYSFVLTPLAFASQDGSPLESYTVAFKPKR